MGAALSGSDSGLARNIHTYHENLCNLTGQSVTFYRYKDSNGLFEPICCFEANGPAPTIVTDDVAVYNLMPKISAAGDSAHFPSQALVQELGLDAPQQQLQQAQEPTVGGSQQRQPYCITARRTTPRSIQGLPPAKEGVLYIVPAHIFHAAPVLGRTDVATPSGPVVTSDNAHGWLWLQII